MAAERLVADTATLAELGQKMTTVSTHLEHAGSVLSKHSSDIGSPDVASALGDFEEHWSRGRRILTEDADKLAGLLADAARSYERTDSDSASAVTDVVIAG